MQANLPKSTCIDCLPMPVQASERSGGVSLINSQIVRFKHFGILVDILTVGCLDIAICTYLHIVLCSAKSDLDTCHPFRTQLLKTIFCMLTRQQRQFNILY
jgi:hypothetical protein